MNILIPMAGHGSRFRDQGMAMPKPLIQLNGQPLLWHALSGLPVHPDDNMIFVTLRAHAIPATLDQSLRQRFSSQKIHWIEIDGVTEGQLCTALLAKSFINTGEKLIIHNCDTYFRSNLEAVVRDPTTEGALTCARVAGDHWSFAKINAADEVLETSEKRRISEWASVGLYYFREGAEFVRSAEAMIQANERSQNEFYIAPLYNRMLQAGKKIRIDRVREFKPMGTPEDLQNYWDVDLSRLKRENGIPVV